MTRKIIAIVSSTQQDMQAARQQAELKQARVGYEIPVVDLTYGGADTLASLDPDGTLHIRGHGLAETERSFYWRVAQWIDVPQPAEKLGDKTPERLCHLLVRAGFPRNFHGTLYLNGYQTGVGKPGETYADQVKSKLNELGFPSVTVKANIGYSRMDRQVENAGKTQVGKSTVKGVYEHNRLNELQASYVRLLTTAPGTPRTQQAEQLYTAQRQRVFPTDRAEVKQLKLKLPR